MNGSEVRIVLLASLDILIKYALRFDFSATNNVVKYEAFVLELQLALEVEVPSLMVYSDSQLIVKQYNKECKANDAAISWYLSKVKILLKKFIQRNVQLRKEQVLKKENS